MRFNYLIVALLVFLCASCGGRTNTSTESSSAKPKQPMVERIYPLMNLISSGEGDYNSVNRGHAGDTPGGIKDLTGKEFKDFTIEQVISMQRKWIHAVGRYQFIPETFLFAVRHSNIDTKTKFTNEVQDKLFAILIVHKRPIVGHYLNGRHTNLASAVDELSKEWASVEYRNGKSFHHGIGGNVAHISRSEAAQALDDSKG